MKATPSILALLAVLACGTGNVSAHRFWIVPSSTVLSGDDPWVTFDAAVSNNLFFADHHAPELEIFTATGPDGKPVKLQNGAEGKYRTTFDLQLTKPGTYKIATVRELVSASWKEAGEDKRFRGTAEEFAEKKIAEKSDVQVTHSASRVETYVTRGEPNTEALKPTGKGLEIVFSKTGPNDLFAKEKATFGLSFDGKPAAGVKVTIIKGDDRYRADAGEITATTNEQGEFEVTWPDAGRFWVNASINQPATEKSPAKRSSYTGVFEVLPE